MIKRKAASSHQVQHLITNHGRTVFEGEMLDYAWQEMVQNLEERGGNVTVARGTGRHQRTIYQTKQLVRLACNNDIIWGKE